MSPFSNENIFGETAGWDVWDVNARVGPSGPHAQLGIDLPSLLEEMSHFYIRKAVAAHRTGIEYDAAVGNEKLAAITDERIVPAWTPLPSPDFMDEFAKRKPKVVLLKPRNLNHSWTITPWCGGELLDYLAQHRVVTLIAREDIEWQSLIDVLENFPSLPAVLLDIGYRFDNYIMPLLRRFPTLHFDNATYLAYCQVENLVERCGPDRLLYGSRLALFTPASSLGVLAAARIPDAARLQIAGGNLRRLLGEQIGAAQ